MQFNLNLPALNYEGKQRRVGYELESAQLTLNEMADTIQESFGGSIKQENEFRFEVIDTEFGKFSVESDSSYLKSKKYEAALQKMSLDFEKAVTDSLVGPSRFVVPNEIVTPPISLQSMHKLEALREKLYLRIKEKLPTPSIAPCGLHLNPEISEASVDYIVRILQAFVAIQDDLFKERHVSLLRRLWPYIEPFPKDYKDLILNSDYQPSFKTLVKDYLTLNPTRNRALDLLPLFAWIDQGEIDSYNLPEAHMIKGRPAFHYRLPNCELSHPKWTLAEEWNSWVKVEALAHDPQRLSRYMKNARPPRDAQQEMMF